MIMDGNRRWAKEKSLQSLKGHLSGYKKMREVVVWCLEEEIPCLILYAFSIENWQRTEKEVSYLMGLFKFFFAKELPTFKRKGIRISCVGDLSLASKDVREIMQKAEKETANFKKLHLVIAFSYGGRREILSAVKEISKVKNRKEIENMTEEDFAKFLWTGKAGVPDPDLIIRTGGEMRLSNFLTWQSVYSELFFTRAYWPDFSHEEFKKILEQFSQRERRLGK